MKRILSFLTLCTLFGSTVNTKNETIDIPSTEKKGSDYLVAAYIWPSCHDDTMGHDILRSEDISEPKYHDASQPVEKRVEDLLSRMSVEEKVAQVSAQLLYMDEFYEKRDYTKGHIRNVGHFLPDEGLPNDPKSVAERINEDTRKSMEASRWGIPVLQHGEALHGAQWGNATCFPQSIAMAATFDDGLYYREGQVVAKELRAVGVRQVYAPVINITRDQRWGRGQESYGEDVLLNARFGTAYVKALEEGGVVATPKHFVDNYGEGGHDSFAYSDFVLPEKLAAGDSLKVKVTVTNTGSVTGDEVVQVYIHDEPASVARPLKQQAGFKRVTLAPGESREMEEAIPYRQFGLWDKDLHFGVEEGWFEVWLGKNADEKIIGGRVYAK